MSVFQLFMKLTFEFRNLQITKLSLLVIPIKQVRVLNNIQIILIKKRNLQGPLKK